MYESVDLSQIHLARIDSPAVGEVSRVAVVRDSTTRTTSRPKRSLLAQLCPLCRRTVGAGVEREMVRL